MRSILTHNVLVEALALAPKTIEKGLQDYNDTPRWIKAFLLGYEKGKEASSSST